LQFEQVSSEAPRARQSQIARVNVKETPADSLSSLRYGKWIKKHAMRELQ
jgi:hypothetical protein